MVEVTNKTLALLVLAALAVVVVATSLQLSKMNDYGLVGFATSDTGDVTLTIADALNIEVDATNADIQFGTCTPWDGGAFTANSSLALAGNPGNANCTGQGPGMGLDNLTLNNIGNVDANVSIVAGCTVAQFLPEVTGTTNDFEFNITGCDGTGADWTTLSTSSLNACTNVSTGGNILMWAAVTIDTDTQSTQLGACSGGTNTITFSALQA